MMICQTCGEAIVQEPKDEKKTLAAAKVNGQGPFCDLCFHLEMSHRYATHRKLEAVPRLIEKSIQWLKAFNLNNK